MVLDKPQPGPQPFDVLPRGGDPQLQDFVFSLERADPETGLRKLGAGMAAFSFSGTLRELRLRALTARPPGSELLLNRGKELLELLQDDSISSFVG